MAWISMGDGRSSPSETRTVFVEMAAEQCGVGLLPNAIAKFDLLWREEHPYFHHPQLPVVMREPLGSL
jgi:hypothetical protein